MTFLQHTGGAIIGICIGIVAVPVASILAMLLFYRGSGFVVDFAPAAILFFGAIWGAVAGAIIGATLLPPTKAALVGLILALAVLGLLFLMNIAEDGFKKVFVEWFVEGEIINLGLVCFFIITVVSSYIIAAVNSSVIKKLAIVESIE